MCKQSGACILVKSHGSVLNCSYCLSANKSTGKKGLSINIIEYVYITCSSPGRERERERERYAARCYSPEKKILHNASNFSDTGMCVIFNSIQFISYLFRAKLTAKKNN
jgi:hypothetical protein